MAEVGSWYVTVMPNMQQFNRTLASAAKTSGSNAGGIFNTAFGVALGSLASGAIRTAFGSLESGIARLDTLENFPRVMENIGVATEDVARSAVKDLAQRLEGLPTRLDDATASVQRFALANGDIETSVEMFDALNNALLSGGSGAELQAAALEQVSQAYSRGKPDMREWYSMTMTMGPALRMVASSWNMSVDEMGEALRNGKIPMQDFFDTLIELNDEGIDGLASLSDQASVSTESLGTALGLIPTRISNAWAQILDAIGREDLVAIIDGATSGMLDAVSTYIVPAVAEAKQAFDDFMLAVQPLQEAFSGLITELQGPLSEAIGAVAQVFQPLFDAFGEFASGEGEAFNGMMERIAGHMQDLQPALQAVSDAWSYFVSAAGPFVEAIAPVLVDILGVIGSALAGLLPIIANIIGAFLNIGGTVLEIGTQLIEGAKGWLEVFRGIPTALVRFFSGIGAKVGAKFTEIKTRAIQVFNGIVDFVRSIPDRIVGFFSGIGSKITSAIGNIHFPMPHVTWEEVGLGIKLPKVKWYAQGGFVNGAQLIGAGEAGTELIWPAYGNALDLYGNAIASHMDVRGSNEELIYWLARNLGPIINEYAPRTSRRELNRATGGGIYV